MIASVHGRVLSVRADRAVIEAGGLGIEILGAPTMLKTLVVGQDARVVTTLVVREDSMTVYGFADDDEREVFAIVQKVSGIGPRIALAVLAHLGPDGLRQAVDGGDIAAIQQVPGIGRKGAQKLVLELSGKLTLDAPTQPGAGPGGAVGQEVCAALAGLGWTPQAAAQAVEAVLADPDAPGDVASMLRAALRFLGTAR